MAMHNDKELVSKYMKPLLVGEVKDAEEVSMSNKQELISLLPL